jgi:hypothetical protein
MKLSVQTIRYVSLGALASSIGARAALAQSADAGSAASLAPVAVTVLTATAQSSQGLIFLTPTAAGSGSHGAQIVDEQGRPVWFHPLAAGTNAFDLRVQRYHGERVLTWIESQGAFSTGPTSGYIADRHYNIIAQISAGDGLTEDIHELHLTPEGTALILAYSTVTRDLTAYGGAASGLITEGIVQEIDIPTGAVLFEWHSLDHVGPDESHAPVPSSATAAWDYFHVNAVSLDEDGNLLVDARNTWAAYRLDRHSGRVLWRLGGKKSDFALGPNVAFAWQHNPTAVDHHGLIRIFDNEAAPPVLPYSRVIWVRHDDVSKTATLERWFKHPDGLQAGSQGNAEGLEDGHTFVGWGALPRLSEFDRDGNLVFDAALPSRYNSYRTYRFEWAGEPEVAPTVSAVRNADGSTTVHAVWNGATHVATWDVVDEVAWAKHKWLTEADRGLATVASASWNGLDTAITVDASVDSVVVIARDREGHAVGVSAVAQVTQ